MKSKLFLTQYIVSVKFLKRLIMISILILMPLSVISLTLLSIMFWQTKENMQVKINQLHAQLDEMKLEEVSYESCSVEDLLAIDTDFFRAAIATNGTSNNGVSFTVAPALVAPSLSDTSKDLMGRSSLAITPEQNFTKSKLAYLTFDDGPSKRTLEILDILDKYDAKATFFVINQALDRYPEICLEAFRRGHAIGIHSSTHKYDMIYQDVESFLLDIEENYLKIKEVTGVAPSVLRFPGGSFNAHNIRIADELIYAVHQRGFKYFDWNSSSGDAKAKPLTPDQLLDNVLATTYKADPLVILFHDSPGKTSTVDGLASIIESLHADGYVCAALNADSDPVHFKTAPLHQMAENSGF